MISRDSVSYNIHLTTTKSTLTTEYNTEKIYPSHSEPEDAERLNTSRYK